MQTNTYTVYDKISQRCGPIFHAVNDEDAIRGFKKRYRDSEDRADFELLRLGSFDHQKGIITALDVPENIVVHFPVKSKEDNGNAQTK